MNTGKSPGQRVIQFIGTPESSDASPRSCSSRDRGCSAANRWRSRSISCAIRSRESSAIWDILVEGPVTAASEPSLVPGPGDCERLARILEVKEQPSAVGAPAGSRGFAGAHSLTLAWRPIEAPLVEREEVGRDVVVEGEPLGHLGEVEQVSARGHPTDPVVGAVDVLAVAVLAEEDAAARADR